MALLVRVVLTQGEVGDDTSEDEGCQEGEGEDEGIEVAIVALPHAVAHPGAVMVKALCESQDGISRALPDPSHTAPSHTVPNSNTSEANRAPWA